MFEIIVIGIVVALLYTEVMKIYPGGIIVPAYFAFYLDQPLRAVATLGVALLSLLCFKLFNRFFLIFGRRRFVLMILLGVFWGQFFTFFLPEVFSAPLALRVIGWIIPGLLANNLERQKFLPTLASLLTVSVLTYFLAKLVSYF